MNNKGYTTIEAAIVVPVVIITIIFLVVGMFNFFHRSYIELLFNRGVMNGKDIKNEYTVDYLMTDQDFIIKKSKYSEEYLDNIIYQDLMKEIGEQIE